VINVITHAPGEATPVADEFFSRPEVRCINFTGSSATGRILAERAGRALKRCVLELGGYNPLIVLSDADLDYAVEATAFAAFFHSGQICMNARKVLVERPVYNAFITRLTARAQALPAGDPADPGTVIGPLITPGRPGQGRQRRRRSGRGRRQGPHRGLRGRAVLPAHHPR
jgi:acyl-CoA reductase-like NAD-dependent aldehyde dehydrogenase